ncbi:Midasin, partial [Stegodyphus mimosarum]
MKALETPLPEEFGNIVWTYSMRRLAVLVGKALEFKEPVLLVGNTGCGKTTMCQIYAEIFGRTLYSVNCHMHSESADFLGGLRPVRDVDERDSKLFEWVDGPLILAMQEGSYFLADEISLADDSVLERLNSVLEPEQTILLAEKCFDTCQESEITAEKGFQFFATMNPGGDYGKKELSPALRNRFTEIWCPSNLQLTQDIIDIVEHNIKKDIYHPYATENDSGFGVAVAEFLSFYTKTDIGRWTTISVRDVLTWVEFINICEDNLLPSEAYLHGAFLVFLDAVGSGPTAIGSPETLQDVKQKCFDFLLSQVGKEALSAPELLLPDCYLKAFEDYPIGPCGESESYFGIGPFVVDFDSSQYNEWCSIYVLDSRTPKLNALRILRAMQLSKPILLEG